jgi:hypothetical protein
MAKAISLDVTALDAPVQPPRAAQVPTLVPAASPAPPKPTKAAKVPVEPLQIRIPAAEIKAIKRAALEADSTVSDFMLACFHAAMNK